MEALRHTFEPWKGKVVFVEKFMSDRSGRFQRHQLMNCLGMKKMDPFFIKLDIEGYEKKALSGMKKLMESGKPVRMNVCTYHYPDDFKEIKAALETWF